MSKSEKLTFVFQDADRIVFDNQSRLIFFSDIHRGDNSWADEFAQNQAIYAYALDHYLNAGFTYIEVGDGDELMKNRHAQHIHTAHAGIFNTLRKFHAGRRFFYIHGNHDIQYRQHEYSSRHLHYTYNHYQDELEPLFPEIKIHEGLVLVHRESGGTIFVTHGHQGEYFNDRFWKISRLLLRYLWRPLQLLGIQNPCRVSSNVERRKDIELQLLSWIKENRQPLLCGHTHCAHLPRTNQLPYFNTGSCVQPRLITGIEIDHGAIMLVRWRVKPGANGGLYVQREIISGPEKLTEYFQNDGQYGNNPQRLMAYPKLPPQPVTIEEGVFS